MSDLDQIVYIVENGQITETAIRDLDLFRFVELTTTPHGVAPALHVRENELWTWGHNGNCPRLISTHETAEVAGAALEDSFAYDFWNGSDIDAYSDFETAKQVLKQLQEDAE